MLAISSAFLLKNQVEARDEEEFMKNGVEMIVW